MTNTNEFPFTAIRQLKNQALVEALVTFLAWQEDKDLLIDHVKQDDYARHLMEVLGMDTDEVTPLIGGSNAPIFRHAAREIEALRDRIDDTKFKDLSQFLGEQIRKLKAIQRHSEYTEENCIGDAASYVIEDSDGEYVRYADLDAIIQEIEKRVKT